MGKKKAILGFVSAEMRSKLPSYSHAVVQAPSGKPTLGCNGDYASIALDWNSSWRDRVHPSPIGEVCPNCKSDCDVETPLKSFLATFIGKTLGAIGISSRYSIIVNGIDKDMAELAIYSSHEHLSDVKLTLLKECSQCKKMRVCRDYNFGMGMTLPCCSECVC